MTENIAKYNFWNNNIPDLGFIRNKYMKQTETMIGNRLVKVLVGQRRVGKSYILRQLMHMLIQKGISPKNLFYVNKEYTDFDHITNYKELEQLIKQYKKELKPVGKIYLFIDEIQTIEQWERIVNSYAQSFNDEYEIFISGSNSEMLTGELATLLSGRYIQIPIYPLDYIEYVELYQLERSKENYVKYMESGGLPELMHLPNDETKRHYLSAIRDTVLLRDIIHRHKIKDPKLLQDIFAFLVNNASNLISINSLVKYFAGKNRKTNYETVANYIEYIRHTFLIHQVERYHIKGKELLAGTYKYYINDLSFKNYLYSGFEYGIGYKLENLIYMQLINSGYDVFVGFMRDKEIDFVAVKNNATKYFQVAYLLMDETTIKREYSALKSIPDNYQKFVVTLDDVAFGNNEGIEHIQAWNLNDIL